MHELATGVAYSCDDLASMNLPGYPVSRQGWDMLVKRQEWPYREVRSKGRGGLRREYQPPPHVMALIEQRRKGEIGLGDERGGFRVRADGRKLYYAEPAPAADRDPVLAFLDPTEEERLQMLSVVLRVAESKLKEPLNPDLAGKILELVAAWTPFAVKHPDFLQRLEALRTACVLFASETR